MKLRKLKSECGANYTAKLEGMIKDVEMSKDVMHAYTLHLQGSQPSAADNAVSDPEYTELAIPNCEELRRPLETSVQVNTIHIVIIITIVIIFIIVLCVDTTGLM